MPTWRHGGLEASIGGVAGGAGSQPGLGLNGNLLIFCRFGLSDATSVGKRQREAAKRNAASVEVVGGWDILSFLVKLSPCLFLCLPGQHQEGVHSCLKAKEGTRAGKCLAGNQGLGSPLPALGLAGVGKGRPRGGAWGSSSLSSLSSFTGNRLSVSSVKCENGEGCKALYSAQM